MAFNNKQYSVAIDEATSGDKVLIAAPSKGFLVVDHIDIIPESAVDIAFKTGTTALTGTYAFDAKQGFVQENPSEWQDGIYTCKNEEAFIMNLGSNVQVSGYIKYRIMN